MTEIDITYILSQSRGCNQPGSSETIRRTTHSFLFPDHHLFTPQHRHPPQPHSLEWVIGFSEGDGSFIIDNSRGRLFFIVNQKDPTPLRYLRTTLGYGSVRQHNGIWRYSVSDKEGIDRLLHLFNGNLLLNKTSRRFSRWLEARNASADSPIPKLPDPVPTSGLLRGSAWFSGFTDAEGCFSISKIKDLRHRAGFRMRFRYILDQKDEHEVLLAVQSFLGTGHLAERTAGEGMWRLTVTHRDSNRAIISYLKKHPLRSRKAVDLAQWEKALRYMEDEANRPWMGKSLSRLNRLIEKRQR